MLATRDKDNSLIAVQLTVDLKPDLPSISLSVSQHTQQMLCRTTGLEEC